MANTLYASFADAAMAEKAAGALLDHGVRAEDLSLVQHESRYNLPTTVAEDTGVSPSAEGEMTGATTDSPGILGTGTYTPPMGTGMTTDVYDNTDNLDDVPMANNGPYGDTTETSFVDASDRDMTGYDRNTAVDAGVGNYAETTMETGTTEPTGVRTGGNGENLGFVSGTTDTPMNTYSASTGFDTDQGRVTNYDSTNVDSNTMTSRTADVDDPAKTENAAKHGISTTTPADAGAGAITGTAVGLGVGAIAALASLLIPGFGLIVGGGALATALGGLVATTGAGAAVGAITGYLKDQGVEEHVAQKYGEAVAGGGAVLAIHVPSGDVDEPKARQVLEKYGATNVNTYAMTENARPYMA